jgi:hypothetical protein
VERFEEVPVEAFAFMPGCIIEDAEGPGEGVIGTINLIIWP